MTDAELTIISTPYWVVKLRADEQTYLGRAIVVCKRPVASIPELTKEEWTDVHAVMAQYEKACRKVFGATLFNWSCLMNLAYQNTPPDPQVHWHVKPRYDHPVTFAGQEFVDKEFGQHYAQGTKRPVDEATAKEMVRALREAIAVV